MASQFIDLWRKFINSFSVSLNMYDIGGSLPVSPLFLRCLIPSSCIGKHQNVPHNQSLGLSPSKFQISRRSLYLHSYIFSDVLPSVIILWPRFPCWFLLQFPSIWLLPKTLDPSTSPSSLLRKPQKKNVQPTLPPVTAGASSETIIPFGLLSIFQNISPPILRSYESAFPILELDIQPLKTKTPRFTVTLKHPFPKYPVNKCSCSICFQNGYLFVYPVRRDVTFTSGIFLFPINPLKAPINTKH